MEVVVQERHRKEAYEIVDRVLFDLARKGEKAVIDDVAVVLAKRDQETIEWLQENGHVLMP